jgi:hypothetical protein
LPAQPNALIGSAAVNRKWIGLILARFMTRIGMERSWAPVPRVCSIFIGNSRLELNNRGSDASLVTRFSSVQIS